MKRESSRSTRFAPIRFATTSVAKFLQARLVLQPFGFDVELLEAHRDPYREPYGFPKREFLRAGLEQVVSRAGAAGLVFIEDTTVSIPGLGRGPNFPGQGTKEWFAEISHTDLMGQIEAAGGDRRATVSSDIALYVPSLYPSFPIFSASTSGRVVESVPLIQSNRLYPWLGRPDFSSWFVPDNATGVLASMELEESIRYDFRSKCLRQLVDRLQEYLAVLNLPTSSVRTTEQTPRRNPAQLTIFPDFPDDIVLIVVGRVAAGKTTVGHYLSLHRGFYHIEGSNALLEAVEAHGYSQNDYGSMFSLADALFENHGYDVVERNILATLLDRVDAPIVYTGCRTLEGAAAMRRAARTFGRPFAILNVSARSSARLIRANARARDESAVDATEFDDASKRDESYGAAAFADLISDAQLVNHTDLTSFLSNIDKTVSDLRRGIQRWGAKRRALTNELAATRDLDGICGVLKSVDIGLVTLEHGQLRLTGRGAALMALLSAGHVAQDMHTGES